MTPKCYGAIAAAIIAICILLAVLMFLPAAFAGFGFLAIVFYVALSISIGTSFYLLAKRRDLHPASLRRLAELAAAALLIALWVTFFGGRYA